MKYVGIAKDISTLHSHYPPILHQNENENEKEEERERNQTKKVSVYNKSYRQSHFSTKIFMTLL